MEQYLFSNEVATLTNTIKSQFINRTEVEGNRTGKNFRGAKLEIVDKGYEVWFVIKMEDDSFNITVPVPYVENGVVFIRSNETKRALCDHFDVKTGLIVSYIDALTKIFVGSPEGIVSSIKIKKYPFIQQLSYAILDNTVSRVVYSIQKAINELAYKMPMHETYMNSWVMNNRLICIDTSFDILSDPNEKLEYHVGKNEAYHAFGWTSVGISDGALVDKNYILKEDIRKYTPFGFCHHNPQRNLYSTLGMKGDEDQCVRTASANALINKGIRRTGWNLFTLYADLPNTFEDQIIVDISHSNKFIVKEKRVECFGNILVKEGDKVSFNDVLSKTEDGGVELYDVYADESWVEKITQSTTSVGNVEMVVHTVLIKYKRFLKDAVKFTNTHGNKGVIRLMDIGYAIDPATGERRKIDVVVSAKTIKKRKNFGQVLEALYNNLHERKAETCVETKTKSVWTSVGVGLTPSVVLKPVKHSSIVISDDCMVTEEKYEKLKDDLFATGIQRDGKWKCELNDEVLTSGVLENNEWVYKTHTDEVSGVCGNVFWGVIKCPEDQLWKKGATVVKNGSGIRTAGLKFSSVEFRALETRFGADNAITEEILSYTQGMYNLNENLQILRSKTCVFDDSKPIINALDIKAVDQHNGMLFREEDLKNTVCDDKFYEGGFILQLPVMYQTGVAIKQEDHYEGVPMMDADSIDWQMFKAVHNTNRLYVPGGLLRSSWKHSSGLYGMNNLAAIVNGIISMSKNYVAEPDVQHHMQMLYRAINVYFSIAASSVATKKGGVATFAMSVRYPFSAKAVATLSNSIPYNTVEIHSSMAKELDVETGDIVIVERFPCLGFMGVRSQKVMVTDDPLCKFTIRSSNNSLVSANLDYDGDVIYLASFHTAEAKEALRKEYETPNEECNRLICNLNTRKGAPMVKCVNLDDIGFISFNPLTVKEQSNIVRKSTGVKAQTGPVIAMAYNLLRIVESSGVEYDSTTKAGIEMFIEKAGQSVFEQKHGGTSLCEIVIEAVCTGDINSLIEEGFDPSITKMLCDLVKQRAACIGVKDIKYFHENYGKNGVNIVNKIVRICNKIYFTSRSLLEGCQILEHLESPAVDLPSKLFKMTTSGRYNNCKTMLDVKTDSISDERLLNTIVNPDIKDICCEMFKIVDVCMAA